MELFWITVAAYFIGTFPTAYLLGKWVYGTDVRRSGSGNVGTFNFIRTTHSRVWGGVVLLIDAGKGMLAMVLAQHFVSGGQLVFPAVAVVLGHVFPVWLKFRGGRGLATLAGIFLFLKPLLVFLWLVIFALLYLVTKKYILSGVASLIFSNLYIAIGEARSLFLIASATSVIVLLKYFNRLKEELIISKPE